MSTTTTVGAVLAHYGVKGMKWGVRRRRSASSSSSSDTDTRSEDFVKARSALAKPASQLSNDEMRDLVTRLNLEKQYVSAVAAVTPATQQSKVARGAQYVGTIVKDIGGIELNRIAKGAAAIAVENALKGEKNVTGKDFAKQVGKRIVPKKK